MSLRNTLLLSSLAAATLLDAAGAQHVRTPAKELSKLDRLLGTWEGEGFASDQPGGHQQPWTSTSSVRKVMGGHFIREDLVVDVGEGMPKVRFTSFMGWDHDNSRYVMLNVGNTGEVGFSEMMFEGDDTLVSFETKLVAGKLTAGRWRTQLGDESYEFDGDSVTMAGRPYVAMTGTMTKVQAVDASAAADTVYGPFIGVMPHKAMQRLAKLEGVYAFKGEMHATPDSPPFPINATQTMTSLYGATVLEMTTDVTGYQAWSAFAWDAREQAIRMVYVNSGGECGTALCHWVGDALVSTHSGRRGGQVVASRTVMPCNSDGHMTRVVTHQMIGAGEPFEGLNLVYERQ